MEKLLDFVGTDGLMAFITTSKLFARQVYKRRYKEARLMVISNESIMGLILNFMGHYGCNGIWCTDKAAFTLLDIGDNPMVWCVRRAQYVY